MKELIDFLEGLATDAAEVGNMAERAKDREELMFLRDRLSLGKQANSVVTSALMEEILGYNPVVEKKTGMSEEEALEDFQYVEAFEKFIGWAIDKVDKDR